MYQKLVDGTASNEERESIESEHIRLFMKKFMIQMEMLMQKK